MVTLLGDVHFWTLRDDVIVKDADIGAFRYQDKSSVSRERVYYEDKRWYREARGGSLTLKNSRPLRLRDSLKELEELLGKERVVWEGWRSPTLHQLIFASGVVVLLTVDPLTGDLTRVVFDKFLVGRLLSEHLADVVITKQHMLFSYNECRLSVVHLTRTPPEGQQLERLSALDPKVHTCEVAGPSGRRFERKLSANLTGDMVVVWWETSEDEVYPWSPLARDRDRANVLVYTLSATSLDLTCYCRTEMAPLSVSFSRVQPNVLLTVEQGFGRKGGVTVLSCVYEVERGALHRVTVTTIPLEAPLTAHAHNPAEDRLLLACNNGVLALHCDARGMTHVTKAGLIPTRMAWLDSGNAVVVANDRGQVQCFDLALSLVRLQLIAEDPSPQRILDFSEHFCHPQSLSRLQWAPSCPSSQGSDAGLGEGSHLLVLHYVRGPLSCLRMDMSSPEGGRLTVLTLVAQYIKHRQLDEAVNLLVSLNWDQEGPTAMRCLSTIVNHLLRMPLTSQREQQLEGALGSFHVPVQPLSPGVEEEFGPAVRSLTRRFFFKVLRLGRLEKALRIGLDLKDHDCFMAVHWAARRRGDGQVAARALQSTRDLQSSCGSSASCSSVLYGDSDGSSDSGSCSDDSCSTCFSDSGSATDSDPAHQHSRRREEYGDGRLEVIQECSSPVGQCLTHLTQDVDYMTLNSGSSPPSAINNNNNNNNNMTTLVPDPSLPHTGPPAPPTHTTAITSQGGTVTINIRQPDPLPHPPHHHRLPGASRRGAVASPPPYTTTPRTSTSPTSGPRRGLREGSGRSVRELFYSSDPNEEFVDSETVSVFVDKKELQSQYERAVYHEVSTEEEDGGTVKVVHFGVV